MRTDEEIYKNKRNSPKKENSPNETFEINKKINSKKKLHYLFLLEL